MERSPGSSGQGPSPSIYHDFTADEIQVANTLACLQFLIPFRHSRDSHFLPPLWGSKRPRSAYVSAFAPSSMSPLPDRPRPEPGVVIMCPVASGVGNRRNISPDSPLLLKDSPSSSGGGRVSSDIADGASKGKKGRKDIVDDSAGIKFKIPSKKKPKKEKLGPINDVELEEGHVQVDAGSGLHGRPPCQTTGDPTSSSSTLPSGSPCATPGSPQNVSRPMLLFDLNIAPADFPCIQSPSPDERDRRSSRLPNNAIGSAKAARQNRMAIRRERISKAKSHSSWRR